MNFLLIIRARTGSSRLPRKMVRDFYRGKTILQILVERLIDKYQNKIWIATTNSRIDDELVNSVSGYGINIYRGSEDNVFSRFNDILSKNESEYFVRICGDNPFLNVGYLDQLLSKIDDSDYISFYDGSVPAIKTHYGVFAELIKSNTILKKSDKKISDLIKEHVSPFIYEDELNYKINKTPLPSELNEFTNLRLTVDTEADFNTAKKLYTKSINLDKPFDYDLNRLLSIIKDEPNFQVQMKKQIEENSK